MWNISFINFYRGLTGYAPHVTKLCIMISEFSVSSLWNLPSFLLSMDIQDAVNGTNKVDVIICKCAMKTSVQWHLCCCINGIQKHIKKQKSFKYYFCFGYSTIISGCSISALCILASVLDTWDSICRGDLVTSQYFTLPPQRFGDAEELTCHLTEQNLLSLLPIRGQTTVARHPCHNPRAYLCWDGSVGSSPVVLLGRELSGQQALHTAVLSKLYIYRKWKDMDYFFPLTLLVQVCFLNYAFFLIFSKLCVVIRLS